jgi:hypothetical protein
MDYDQQLTKDEIRSLVTAKNPLGQSIPVTIETSNFAVGTNLPGLYQMVLIANYYDTYHRYILDIKVMDVTKPVITAPTSIDVPISEKKTMDQIKAMITVSDNVDTLSSTDLVVTNDTYSSATQIGTYSISFQISDSSNNTSQITVPIVIQDTRGPLITGPFSIFIYATDQPLSNLEILSRYTAFDTEEGVSKTVTITSNTYNQQTVPNVYDVRLESVANLGNKSIMNVKIHVIETSDVHIYYNEYSENITLDGSYFVYMKYTHENQEQLARILVNVENDAQPAWEVYGVIGLTLISTGFGFFMIKKRK